MKKINILAVTFAAVMAVTTVGLTSCGGSKDTGVKTYTISKHFDDNNKGEIPTDAVNQVMFAYSDTCDVTFKTELTLDSNANTYVLLKTIQTVATKDESGNDVRNYDGGYEFKGTYTLNGEVATLSVPTETRYYCYYPTVLNYQSIEKQTQDWVSSKDAAFITTRFNNWYPAKNAGTKEQSVTLSGSTMTFGAVTFEEEKPTEQKTEAPSESATTEEAPAKEIKISATSANGSYVINFFTDKTYEWVMSSRNLKEEGTFALNESHQLVLTCTQTGTAATGVINEDQSQTITYEPSTMGGYASMMADTFTLAVTQWGQLTLL